MKALWMVLSLLAQGVDPNAPLPPGHPAIGGSSTGAGAIPSSGTLPPGHPAIGQPPMGEGAGAGAGALPPGHPQVDPSQKPLSTPELIQKLDATADLKERPKTFEVAASLGKLYYATARYADAAVYLKQAMDKADPARAVLVEARAKAGKAARPSLAEAGCPLGDASLDASLGPAREKLKAGNAAAAAACAEQAWVMVSDVGRQLSNAHFLAGDGKASLAVLDGLLTTQDADAEALFLRGAVRLDIASEDAKALGQSKKDLERCLAVAPNGPRAAFAQALLARLNAALGEGGLRKLDAKEAAVDRAKPVPNLAAAAPPPFANAPFAGGGGGGGAGAPALSQDAINAVQNTERTPELESGLQKLVEEGEDHLAHGRFEEALNAYKRVVPFQPNNGRAKAGMAWALVGLGKPMADRIWGVAVSADPSAVDHLGDALKAKGDANGAKLLWQKLAQTDQSYAQSSGLNKKL